MTPAELTTIGAAVAALIGGGFSLMSATKANRPAESNAQLAWVKQAQDEVVEVRKELREVRTESTAARAESEVTRQQQVKLRRELDAMQEWVDRVVRARDRYVADHPIDTIDDSGMITLLRAINGGPAIEP